MPVQAPKPSEGRSWKEAAAGTDLPVVFCEDETRARALSDF